MSDPKTIGAFSSLMGRHAVVEEHNDDGVVFVVRMHAPGREAQEERFDPHTSAAYDAEADSDTNEEAAKNDALERAGAWVAAKPTNVEVLLHLMNHAKSGPLMEAFIMQALAKSAEAMSDKLIPENGFIHPKAWQACAIELRDVLKAHLA